MIKVLLYVIVVPLSIWAIDSINLTNVLKKNRYYQARFLYLMISFGLSYLTVNFLYDFFINSQFIFLK